MLKSLFTLRDGAGLTVQQQQQQHGASVVSLAALSASSNYGHYGGHEPSHHHHHHHHGGGGGGASGSGGGGGAHSPGKYQENGHDTFSDFVTLVCQEAAQNTQNSPQVNWNYVYSLNSSAKIGIQFKTKGESTIGTREIVFFVVFYFVVVVVVVPLQYQYVATASAAGYGTTSGHYSLNW